MGPMHVMMIPLHQFFFCFLQIYFYSLLDHFLISSSRPLFLALPVSWKGTLIQYTGRLHRIHPGKTEVRIFDYVDRDVPMLERMFEKRLRGYRAIGYARGEAPLGYTEAVDETAVEYDQDVLRSLKALDSADAATARSER